MKMLKPKSDLLHIYISLETLAYGSALKLQVKLLS